MVMQIMPLAELRKTRIQYIMAQFEDQVFLALRPKARASVICEAREVARQAGTDLIVKPYGKAPVVCRDGAWETFTG